MIHLQRMPAFHDKDTGAQPTPSTIPQRAMDTDTSGIISTYQRNGDTQTSSNAFFENLGTNGRTWLPPDANGLVGDPLAGNPTNAQFTPNIFIFCPGPTFLERVASIKIAWRSHLERRFSTAHKSILQVLWDSMMYLDNRAFPVFAVPAMTPQMLAIILSKHRSISA